MGISYFVSGPPRLGGGSWVERPPEARALWPDLERLVRRIQAKHPPIIPWDMVRYRREPIATSGPRAGSRNDQWLAPWELPLVAGYLQGDCEDLAAWWVASMRDAGVPAMPVIAEYRDPQTGAIEGWHALGAAPDPDATLPIDVYGGPVLRWGAKGWKLHDPSWRVGMWHPDLGYHPLSTDGQRERRP